ncbi:hypothetical protein TcCL_NonESM04718 [Trypanosoma cruzi]|nr:hypothetical protein TcCL_NonESM04718 [Trypanosoma cruzi]
MHTACAPNPSKGQTFYPSLTERPSPSHAFLIGRNAPYKRSVSSALLAAWQQLCDRPLNSHQLRSARPTCRSIAQRPPFLSRELIGVTPPHGNLILMGSPEAGMERVMQTNIFLLLLAVLENNRDDVAIIMTVPSRNATGEGVTVNSLRGSHRVCRCSLQLPTTTPAIPTRRI